jgi:hypothetical protein
MEAAKKMGSEHDQKAIADLGAIHRGDWGHAFIDTGGTGRKQGRVIAEKGG